MVLSERTVRDYAFFTIRDMAILRSCFAGSTKEEQKMRQYGVFVASVTLLSIAILLALTPTALAVQSPEPREPITDTIKEQDQRLNREALLEWKEVSPDALVSQSRNLAISAFDQVYTYT